MIFSAENLWDLTCSIEKCYSLYFLAGKKMHLLGVGLVGLVHFKLGIKKNGSFSVNSSTFPVTSYLSKGRSHLYSN